MTVSLVDPSLLGTDVRMRDDIDPVWGLVTGIACLAQDLYHRLTVDRGGLFYSPNYGFNVINLLNGGFTPAELAAAQQSVAAECRKDPRVRSCAAKLTLNFERSHLLVDLKIDSEEGPFTLVLAATAVTVELLSINGVQQTTTTTTAAATTGAGGTTVVVVSSGGGTPGPAGPAGAAGTPQTSITFGDNIWSDDTGSPTETWQGQREVNMTSLPAGTITVEFVAQVRTDSGTATFRLRLGGGDTAVDGTILATMTTTSASFEEKMATATFTNPTGLKRLKVTIEAAAAGQFGEIKGITVTFR